jgi:hypothetical protein
MKTHPLPFVLAASFLLAAVSQAQINIAFRAGVNLPNSGEVHNSGTLSAFQVDGLFGTEVSGFIGPDTAVADIQERSFRDIYGSFGTYAIEVGFGSRLPWEAYLGLSYMRGNASVTAVGTLPDFGPAQVLGDFSDFQATSLYAGARYTLSQKHRGLFPYIGAFAGYRRLSSIDVQFSVPELDLATAILPFYKSSDTLIGGLSAGITKQLENRWSLNGELGLVYQTALARDDTALGALGLSELNNTSGLWAVSYTFSIQRSW